MSGNSRSIPTKHHIRASIAASTPTAPPSNRMAPQMDHNAASNLVDGAASGVATPTYPHTSWGPFSAAYSNSNAHTHPNTDASPTPSRNSSHRDVSILAISYTEQAEQLPARPSRAQRQMIDLPRLREVNLRQDRKINWGRAERHDAVLGQTRGNIAIPECHSCTDRHAGPFTSCVVVPGLFQGQCCNCRYMGRGNCSFREVILAPEGQLQPTPLRQPTNEQYNQLLRENYVLQGQNEALIRASNAMSQQVAISTRLLDMYEARQRVINPQVPDFVPQIDNQSYVYNPEGYFFREDTSSTTYLGGESVGDELAGVDTNGGERDQRYDH